MTIFYKGGETIVFASKLNWKQKRAIQKYLNNKYPSIFRKIYKVIRASISGKEGM